MNILEWINNNLELLFGGVGLFTFIYIIKFFYWIKTKKNNSEQIENIHKKYLDIVEGRIRGHSGVSGLIEAGAAQLSKNRQLIELCDKIVLDGKPNPLDFWILKYLKKKECLKFIKWQARNNIGYAPYYFNENRFKTLIERYKKEK